MPRAITLIVVAAALLNAKLGKSQTDEVDSARDKAMFATNECWGKGGLGIINKNLYIVLKSDENQLLNAGQRWTGLGRSNPEVIIYFGGTISELRALPGRFDLSKSIVVSFETDKVRFFDFTKMSGGYYRRRREDARLNHKD